MKESSATYDAICWEGGLVQCGMNLWFLPEHGRWPSWDAWPPSEDHWEVFNADRKNCPYNPYAVFFGLFSQIHPFQFEDAHDPGDEDVNR